MTRLILVRHGEVDESAQGVCCGRLDPALSAAGIRQMQSASRLLVGLPVVALYASASRRALESARLLAPRLEVRTDARLCEINFGKLEGLRYEQAAALYPDVYRQWMERPHIARFPDGESFPMMRTRVLRASHELLCRHTMQTIALVAHGGVNRILLARALGLAPRYLFRLAQDHAGVNIIEYDGVVPTLRLLNATGRDLATPC